MTRYWIGVASRDHVKVGEAGGFCQLNHGKSVPVRRMRPGDRIVYYSPRTEMRGGDTVQAFTAIGAIAEGEPYAGDMGGGFVPMRRDVRFFPSHDAPIRPLLDALSFTRGRKSWGAAFRYGLIEIDVADYGVIAQAMGVSDKAAVAAA